MREEACRGDSLSPQRLRRFSCPPPPLVETGGVNGFIVSVRGCMPFYAFALNGQTDSQKRITALAISAMKGGFCVLSPIWALFHIAYDS